MSLGFRLFTVAASVVQALGFRDYAMPKRLVLADATPELDALLRETLASVIAARGGDDAAAAGVRVVEVSFDRRPDDASADAVALMMTFRTDFGAQWRIGRLEEAKLPASVRQELERAARPDEMRATFLWRP